ncbi:MAG: nucleoside deaminase [Chloroflexi bacterium]|nr:nucleoside deaminase [Chloroflexota bacterium]MBP8058161.1 nucleoside deaminase [Chloroflexota bacterium]
MSRFPVFTLQLPSWVETFLPDPEQVYPTVEARMRLVIALSRQNVIQGTGGPFGAGIFNLDTGQLLAPGINLVIPTHSSVAHAEMVAFMIAQQVLGTFDLGGTGLPPFEIVASTEPCAMCFGAVPWSGVKSLVCGARGEDAEAVGFDEGPKVATWWQELEKRHIGVTRDVLREDAAAILSLYAQNGHIYNARQG